jgi:hypothetical protein
MGWPQWTMLVVGLAATAGVTVLITRKVRQRLDAPKAVPEATLCATPCLIEH